MKINTLLYLFLLTAFVISCLSDKHNKYSLAYIDTEKSYPEKVIFLTDIADITYLYLNSDDDDYLYSNVNIKYLTRNTVVVYSQASGDVLFFSKDGIPKSRFNHRGNGPEEYIGAMKVIYDEEADDVFVIQPKIIMVYSSVGEYKRKIAFSQAAMVGSIISFDDHSLLLYDARKRLVTEEKDMLTNSYEFSFVRISKIDGKVLDYVEIPDNTEIILKDVTTGIPGKVSRLITCKDGVLLCNPETDTVFLYSKGKSLTPIIHKTPSVSSTDPMVYLNNCVDVDSYQFFEIFTVRLEQGAFPFPVKYFLKDKKTGEIFRQKIILPDYKEKDFFISPSETGLSYDDANIPCIELNLIELKQAYHENKLSGKLKELVATLNEDEDNNVFMLVNFK